LLNDLRAALATRPQPDEVRWLLTNVPFSSYCQWRKDGNTKDADKLNEWDQRTQRVLAKLAVAGSAPPTTDQDVIDQEKRDASLAAFYGLAASATPTEENNDG
jgi:hypothetical protein